MKCKTQSPEKTVHNVRNILHQNGIFTIESWIRNQDLPDSVRINVHDLPIGTNGKGVDCKYAAASGYAEFLERLQNLILLNKSNFIGNHDINNLVYSDNQVFDYEYFKKKHLDIITALVEFDDISELDKVFADNDIPLDSLPFLHFNTNKTVYLPKILMDLSIGSNGMCAGNSSHEALIQGLCEIFERYVLKEIHKDANLSLPIVPDSYLENTKQWDCIQCIRSKGYEIYVKDCSLQGRFPVVGVLLVKDDKAMFNLGACTNFSIALERCLTEIMQGIDFNNIDSVMKPIGLMETPISDDVFSTTEKQISYQYFNNLFTSQGIVPPIVFDHTGEFEQKYLFNKNDILSEAALADMLLSVEQSGYGIYFRDVSFLGFPTYKIYIPGMSEVMGLGIDLIQHVAVSLSKAKKIFFNIDNAKDRDIRFLIKTIEYINDEPLFLKKDVLSTIYGLSFRQTISLDDIAPEIVISVLHYKIGDYENAYKKLHAYLCKTIGEENLTNPPSWAEDQLCLLTFFALLDGGHTVEWILEHLKTETSISPSVLESTYELLLKSNSLSEYLDIPRCGDCGKCNYQGICCFESWKGLNDAVQSVINENPYDSIKTMQLELNGTRQ